jgi:quercetin dioxygenase-like cupin family protein
MAITLGLIFAVGVIGIGLVGARQPGLSRTEVMKTSLAGMPGKEAHMWIAEIAPGAATGEPSHPTPRFVYVMEGSVILEVEGKPPQAFRAGEGLQEMPDTVHNFRNGSITEPAKALGFQIVTKGQPLQYR